MLRGLLATLILLGISAFASSAGAQEQATATVVFQRGYSHSGALFELGDQEYLVLDSDGMSFRRAANFGPLLRRETRSRELPAGERLTINAILTYSQRSVGQCNGRARFTPIAGHSYTVVQQEMQAAVCEFRVVDVTTGAPPPDLEIVNDISGRAR
jgi:hypothetical protein